MEFPVFRKYLNGQSYFRIHSPSAFEELKILGKAYALIEMKTKTLPERNFLADMLEFYHQHWSAITEEEYEHVKKDCIAHKKKVDL